MWEGNKKTDEKMVVSSKTVSCGFCSKKKEGAEEEEPEEGEVKVTLTTSVESNLKYLFKCCTAL